MSHTINFDTLRYVKKMKEAGLDEKIAEAQAEALADFAARQSEDLATKADLQAGLADLQAGLRELELKIVIKFGALLAASVGILAAIIKL